MRRVTFTFETGAAISSIEHFLDEIRRFAGRGDYRVYFRGQPAPAETLAPSIGRKHFYLGRSMAFNQSTERKLLDQFRRHSYQHFGRIANEWEALLLARHYELPTRLLDWTSNPLVALYFAAFYENEQPVNAPAGSGGVTKLNLDGTIWGIQHRAEIEELDIFRDHQSPLDIPGIKLVLPFNPTPRITAQSSIFTLHGDPWTDMVAAAALSYAPRDLDVSKLIKWTVASRHKTEIVLELERLAINSRTLFPDLDGLARGLWQTEIIQKCFRLNRSRPAARKSYRSKKPLR